MIISLLPVDSDFLLLEVPTVILINQNEIQDVLYWEFTTDVLVTGGHVDAF